MALAIAITRMIPMQDATVLSRLRVAYVFSNLSLLGIGFYIHLRITRISKEHSSWRIGYKRQCVDKLPADNGARGQTGLDFQRFPSDRSIHVGRHDRHWLWRHYKSILRSFIFVGVLHLYLGKSKVLVLQTLLPLSRFVKSNLFKVHVLGRPATGPLERPWKEDSLLQTVKKLWGAGFPPEEKNKLNGSKRLVGQRSRGS
jgi:hypothetical protein